MADHGGRTILEEIDAVLDAAGRPAKAVMLTDERWSTLCEQNGVDRDAVLMQHRTARGGAEIKVLIMRRSPIG